MRRHLIKLGIVLGILVLASVALANVAERWLIYPFLPTEVAPADIGLTVVHARYVTVDGHRLVVWTAAPQHGKPVIVYFHGNAGNLASRAGRFNHFVARGYGLIALAYRGSSGSQGSPVQAALVSDVAPILQATSDIKGPRVYYGESLGTAVLIESLAHAQNQVPFAPVILEAPFTSLHALAEVHYPQLASFSGKMDNKWDSLGFANILKGPLLVLHGTQDTLIPIEQGRQIYAAAPSTNKHLETVQGAGHTDLWRSDTLPKLWQFIETYAVAVK